MNLKKNKNKNQRHLPRGRHFVSGRCSTRSQKKIKTRRPFGRSRAAVAKTIGLTRPSNPTTFVTLPDNDLVPSFTEFLFFFLFLFFFNQWVGGGWRVAHPSPHPTPPILRIFTGDVPIFFFVIHF